LCLRFFAILPLYKARTSQSMDRGVFCCEWLQPADCSPTARFSLDTCPGKMLSQRDNRPVPHLYGKTINMHYHKLTGIYTIIPTHTHTYKSHGYFPHEPFVLVTVHLAISTIWIYALYAAKKIPQ